MDVKVKQERIGDVDHDAPDEQIQSKLDSNLKPQVSVLNEASTSTQEQASNNRILERPLLSMLPEKYANMDVKELFPHFRKDKPIRFLQIFESNRVDCAQENWRGVKRNLEKLRKDKTKNPDSNSDEETKHVVSKVMNIQNDFYRGEHYLKRIFS